MLGIVANYLPPDTFHYGRDPEGYFTDNSVIWSDLSECDLLVGGGDLNSRTKSDLDYIPEIDGKLIPPRSNPDTIKNSHGSYFLQFLKENRALICNGRISPHLNDFTFLSTRGRSVPDYIYCPTDQIHQCREVEVVKVSDIIARFNLAVPNSIPDHSILVARFDISTNEEYFPLSHSDPKSKGSAPQNATFIKRKKDIRKIDETFFTSEEVLDQINSTIVRIELANVNQKTINEIYEKIKNIFLEEMSKLPDQAGSSSKTSRRLKRKSHAFWNEELQELWSIRCNKERIFSKFISRSQNDVTKKKILKEQFQAAQKDFDKKFRFYKRKNRADKSKLLEENAEKNPNEMWKYIKSLSEPKSSKVVMEIIRQDNTISTDIKEVLDRWHSDISGLFSGIRENPDLAYNDDFFQEICDLKVEFENLSKEEQVNETNFDTSLINAEITMTEVSNAISKAKSGKSYLEVPNEALKNEAAKKLLLNFFNICFSHGISPIDWDKSDIKPIPKKDKDPRDPLGNRCITIMCCIAKIYSSILNARVQAFLEKNQILVDEQNGFRASRSCIDHIFTLVTILRNRKSLGKSSFICFIDFKKAFDSVDRTLLLHKLSKIGIVGNIYYAISSLFKSPKSRVILNNFATDWFECPIGVKQGDIISPTLFAIYINDLATELNSSGFGVKVENDLLVNCLLYADDIVLLAESEMDLQSLLSIVNVWCAKWRLEVNLLKTKVMHIRKKQCRRSGFNFVFEGGNVEFCENYKYLGITINEHLSYEKARNDLAESASRALSGIITKMIKNGGFPFNVYTVLYESCVCSITDYGSEVLGFSEYQATERVHNKAARAYLGVTRSTPIPGIRVEMGWLEPRSRTQARMIRMLHRLVCMHPARLTKKIFLWDQKLTETSGISTWGREVKDILTRNNLQGVFNENIFDVKATIEMLKSSLLKKDQLKLKNDCAMPKLRTFNQIVDFSSTKAYLMKPLSFPQRKAMAKTRLGVLPIRLETGRYERPKVAAEHRLCQQCNLDVVEDESHFLLSCPSSTFLRDNLFSNITNESFDSLTCIDKIKYLLNSPDIVKHTANFIIHAFDNRLIP